MADEAVETLPPAEAPEIPLSLRGTALGKWLDSLEGPRPDDEETTRKAKEVFDNLSAREERGELTEEEADKQHDSFYRQTLLPVSLRRDNPQFKESLSALLKEILLPEGRLGFSVSWKISPDLEHLPVAETVLKQEARDQEIAEKIVEAIQGGNLTVLEAVLYAYRGELASHYTQWHRDQRKAWLEAREEIKKPPKRVHPRFGGGWWYPEDPGWEERAMKYGFHPAWSELSEREYQSHLQKLESISDTRFQLTRRGSKFNKVTEENGGKWAPWERYIGAGWDKNRAAISTTSTS